MRGVPEGRLALRVRARWIGLGLLLLGLTSLWTQREPLLARIGRLVVEETELAPAHLGVLLSGNPILVAAEGATLVNNGYVPHVLLFAAPPGPEEGIANRLGIALPKPHEVTVLVMRRMGVRPEAILVEPALAAGTNAGVRAVARYARRQHATRLIVVTHRSHTRRTAKLLGRSLARGSLVVMRASPHDPYQPDQWWRDRDSARELLTEGLRWVNSFLLGDFWREEERAHDGSETRLNAPAACPARGFQLAPA